MSETIRPLIQCLKATRKAKKLSQRSLAQQVNIPQSHLSKIESGSVDLRLSSLIELARTLELEVMLVPRTVIVPVSVLVRNASLDSSITPSQAPLSQPAYTLDHDEDG